ncbi:MAG TPA: sugar ABC transporter permease [Chloroflexota bacterium]|nr:sugar ABC transporter permease [Chloroflexota bacterium]
MIAKPAATARHSRLLLREERWGFIFITPFLLFFAVFNVIPSILAFWLSVVTWQPATGATQFIGLEKFGTLAREPTFWKAMENTFYYAALVTPASVLLALITAALIYALPWGGLREFFQGAFYLPGIVAAVAVAVIWRFIYDYEIGLLNAVAGLFGVQPVNWLGNPHIAMLAVALMEVLTGLGGAIIIFIAAIGGIPQSLYDAAKIDGAMFWQEFFQITLPLLVPAILYVAVVRTIGAFQVFVPIYLLTSGGPSNATLTIGFLIYRQLFYYADISLASATGLALLVATLVFTVVQFRWFKSVVEY